MTLPHCTKEGCSLAWPKMNSLKRTIWELVKRSSQAKYLPNHRSTQDKVMHKQIHEIQQHYLTRQPTPHCVGYKSVKFSVPYLCTS